jgi:acetyltransferase-like isoleucine patch superfamily enzyme
MKLYFKIKILIKKIFLIILFILKYKYRFKNAAFIHPFSNIGINVTIGKGTRINGKCFISNETEIGNYCAIAHNFRVRHRNHSVEYPNIQDYFQNKFKFMDLTVFKGSVKIGDASWIGDNVIFLPGSGIGKGCVVGANSVVTKKFDDFSIIVGNPAKQISKRFSEEGREKFLNSKWWEWNKTKIRSNKKRWS